MGIGRILGVLCAVQVLAQTPPPPAFEAATIKPSHEQVGSSSWHSRPGYLVMRGQTLKGLIGISYGVRDYQISGGPKWLDSDGYDIEARAAGPAQDPQLLAMLQTLLADRFQLSFHRESKMHPAYELGIAKGGLKIQPVEGVKGSKSRTSRGQLTAEGVSMAKLAEILARILRSPVVDTTATGGVFSFKLEWAPEGADSSDLPAGASLYTALQEQLGMKLESRKAPVEVLVIDRAEKPSDN